MSKGKSGPDAMEFANVTIALEDRILLTLNCHVQPGRVLTVMGPSGSGKSSLLAYVAGFLDPAFTASGDVFLGGVNLTTLPAEARRVGLLFQDALLFPHMTVYQNLAFAIPRTIASTKAARDALIAEALNNADLDGMEDRDPETLSGGQKSRIALMRVLLASPRALLLDEPFSKLDAGLRQQMRQFVFGEAQSATCRYCWLPTMAKMQRQPAGLIINLEHGTPQI